MAETVNWMKEVIFVADIRSQKQYCKHIVSCCSILIVRSTSVPVSPHFSRVGRRESCDSHLLAWLSPASSRVGNLDAHQLRPVVARLLASLPSAIWKSALLVCLAATFLHLAYHRISADTPSMAPSILSSILPSSVTAPDYLLPFPAEPALDAKVKAELQVIEQEFSLDKALLEKTMKQMLWEYQTGLAQHADETNRDTFLPMMSVHALVHISSWTNWLVYSPTYIHNVPDGTETGTFLGE